MAAPGAPPPHDPAPSSPESPGRERLVVTVEAELAPLIEEYLANRRADVGAILTLLAAADYQGIWERGHNLKGVGAAYGFPFLSDLGATLEAAARRRDSAEVRRGAAALEDYLARLDVRLEDA